MPEKEQASIKETLEALDPTRDVVDVDHLALQGIIDEVPRQRFTRSNLNIESQITDIMLLRQSNLL